MESLELYKQIKTKRSLGLDYQIIHRWKRQEQELWSISRERIWQRDRGICQSPEDKPPKQNNLCQRLISLEDCHIDHIRPLSSGGSNHARNLRTLCPICHGLRLDEKHRSLTNELIKTGRLPIKWKHLTWL
ncbi:MAG: HNH endonuclease [Chroococcidiopsis sp.]